MSYNRRHSYDPRADYPPLIGRIPTPPHRRTTFYRPDSPELIGRIPTPPLTTRSFSPPQQVETRVHTTRVRQPRASVGSRFYNLFRPQARRVEIIETPIRRSHTVRVQRAPTPPPVVRDHRRQRRRSPPRPSTTQSAIPSEPPRRNINHGMSPRVPQDYVPLPERQPPVNTGNPSPPNSRERVPSGSPRGRGEFYASPWADQEVVGDDQPHVTEPRPVRANPNSREANLTEQNKDYRDRLKRMSRELEQYKADVAALRLREEELKNQLADERDRSRRRDRSTSIDIDDLRDQLRRCQLDREVIQRERDQVVRENQQQERELESLRRQRPTVVHYDDDDQPRQPRGQTESAGLAAIREAQARGRGRGNRGYRG